MHLLYDLNGLLLGLWKWLKAALVRWYFRVGEVEAVLREGLHSPAMSRHFALAARRSAAIKASPGTFVALFGSELGTSFGETNLSLPSLEDVASMVAQAERFDPMKPNLATIVLPNLRQCINSLRFIQHVQGAVERMCATAYNPANGEHEKHLLQCWDALQPGKALSGRISKDWQTLGFQGSDPATDFRSSGEFGLRVLHHFASRYGAHGQAIIRATELPYKGYPLALALMHTALFTRQLLVDHQLDACFPSPPKSAAGVERDDVDGHQGRGRAEYMYSDCEAVAQGLTALCDIASRLLLLFDDAWADAKPASVMEFEPVFSQFKTRIRHELEAGDGRSRSSQGRLRTPRRLMG